MGFAYLSADTMSISSKMVEQNLRRYSLYPEATSGHMTQVMEFTPGKTLEKGKYFGCDRIPYNELIISSIHAQDIIGIVVTDDSEMLSWHNRENSTIILQYIIEQKEMLENTVINKQLPLLLLDSCLGKIVAMYGKEEISSTFFLNALGGLKCTAMLLDIHDFSFNNFNRLLWIQGIDFSFTKIAQWYRENQQALQSLNDTNQPEIAEFRMFAHGKLGKTDKQNYLTMINKIPPEQLMCYKGRGVRYRLIPAIQFFCIAPYINNLNFRNVPIEFKDWHYQQLQIMCDKMVDFNRVVITHDDMCLNQEGAFLLLCKGATFDLTSCMLKVKRCDHMFRDNETNRLLTILNLVSTSAKAKELKLTPEHLFQAITKVHDTSLLSKIIEDIINSLNNEPAAKIRDSHIKAIKFLVKHGANYTGPIEHETIKAAIANVKSSISDNAIPSDSVLSLNTAPTLSSLLHNLCTPDILITPLMNMEQIVLEVIKYYKSPSESQVIKLISTLDKVEVRPLFRNNHHVDHVLRCMIICEAFVDLQYQYDPNLKELIDSETELRKLIPLALLYHDVVAEVEPKEQEEKRAAEIFLGDLKEAGFRDSNLDVVASALRNKNTNTMGQIHEPFTADEHTSKIERLIRRLVRIPDAIDIVRVRTIANDYPKTSSESQKECFNIQCLDIDPILATNDQFMNDLHDFLIHTLNLAYVTGGMPKVDLRQKPYSQQHHFTQNPELNQARKKHIVFSSNPLNAIVIELDNNVRRHVAMVAGINVTSDHQLNQVEFPALTLLEKFQLNRPSVNNKLKPFIGKLKEAPQFRPALGSIRQDRLIEAPYRQRLENDYGLKAIEVQRQRGYKDDETPNYVNVWQVIEGN